MDYVELLSTISILTTVGKDQSPFSLEGKKEDCVILENVLLM